MTLWDAAHLSATAADTALLWLTQLLIYPQFFCVSKESFPEYHRLHMRRMMAPVGVIYLAEGLTAAVVTWRALPSAPVLSLVTAVLFLAQVALTFLWFVPCHQRLAEGASPELLRRLLSGNWSRVGLESARLALVIASTIDAVSAPS